MSSSPDQPLSDLAQRYLDLLLATRRDQATSTLLGELHAGRLTIERLYLEILQPVLYEVGRRWQANEITIAHEHFVSAAAQSLMSRLYPQLFATTRRGRALVSACVGDEHHEIGLRMVTDLFELNGWDTYYLGTRLPAKAILAAVAARGAHALALSVTIPEHREDTRELILALRSSPGIATTIVLVGGAAFSAPGSWREVGADGYASDAMTAVHLANQIFEQRATRHA